jgi:hypothetical protein
MTRQRRDHGQVLGLDQGDAALAAATGIAIADESLAGDGLGLDHLVHHLFARGPQADPLDPAGTRQGRHQLAQFGIRGWQGHGGRARDAG